MFVERYSQGCFQPGGLRATRRGAVGPRAHGAWQSDTNAVEVKGAKPLKRVKVPKPKWLRDFQENKQQ